MPSLVSILMAGACQGEVENELPPSVILSERRGDFYSLGGVWDADAISLSGVNSVDELLAMDPAFSLYRRQSADFSHPTASGVSLANTGANAASRSLVLRDGIPQNDPFGGWISWVRYDPGTLESARIASASESVVWGNLSPAGSIQLTSREIEEDRVTLRTRVGSNETRGVSATLDRMSEDRDLAVSINVFSLKTSGFYGLHRSQRGSIDRRLDLTYSGMDFRLKWEPSSDLIVESAIGYYEENRGNGTPLSSNESEALDISLRITHERGSSRNQYLAYHQRRDFSSVFTSVNADRSGERIALDQYRVPGEGSGGAIVHERSIKDGLKLTVGADFRRLSGETNEDAGVFRRRYAGGRQNFLGVFARAVWDINNDTQLAMGTRFDHWSLDHGYRREISPGSGKILRDEDYPDRSSGEPSVSISLQHDLGESHATWVAVGSSYRLPTINELYRPFRVRSDVTEANPMLDPERYFSLEAGYKLEWSDQIKASAVLYHHWIRDAIANVPVTRADEIARIFGSLPPGGAGAQRQNVDRARAFGLRASLEWMPSRLCSIRVDGLWSRSEFTHSPEQELMSGQSFPQSPELQIRSTILVKPTDSLDVFAGIDFTDQAYDDSMGVRMLPSFWTCRVGARWQVNESLSLNTRVENVFDQEITTGLSSNGLRSIGRPRMFWVGAEYTF